MGNGDGRSETKLRAEAPSWIPGYGFASYANMTNKYRVEATQQGRTEERETDKLAGYEKLSLRTALGEKRQAGFLSLARKNTQERNIPEVKLERELASAVVKCCIQLALSRTLQRDLKKSKTARAQAKARLAERWRKHWREFESAQRSEITSAPSSKSVQEKPARLKYPSLGPPRVEQEPQVSQPHSVQSAREKVEIAIDDERIAQACASGDTQTILNYGNQECSAGRNLAERCSRGLRSSATAAFCTFISLIVWCEARSSLTVWTRKAPPVV